MKSTIKFVDDACLKKRTCVEDTATETEVINLDA